MRSSPVMPKPSVIGIDVGELLAIAQHHALRPVARSRGEEDHAVVARRRLREKIAASPASRIDAAKNAAGSRRIAATDGESTAPPTAGRRDAFVMDDEARPQLREDARKMRPVHLDMDGADRRAIGHDAEIADDMLDRVVRGEHDPVAGRDPLPAQEGGDSPHQRRQIAVAQGPAVIGGNDVGLVGMKLGRAVDPRPQQAGTRIGSVRRYTVQCNIAHLDVPPAGTLSQRRCERQAWKPGARRDRMARAFLAANRDGERHEG